MVKPDEVTSGLRERASDIRDSVRDLASNAREAAGETMEHWRESATESLKRGKQRATEVEKTIEHYIRDEPMKSVLIAAGVGLLIGFLWKRD